MSPLSPIANSRLFAGERYRELNAFLSDSLQPIVGAVDTEGVYPRAVMAGLGKLGGFGGASVEQPLRLDNQLQTLAAVGRYCGSTAFTAWCQSASAWYLEKAPETAPKAEFLAGVLKGELQAGSGMSNFLKHYAGIEKIRLQAKETAAGYEVSGVLPWVSNLDHNHLLFTAAAVGEGRYIMFVTPTDTAGLELHPCPTFSGMEGTNTWNVRMKNVVVPHHRVLAHPQQFAEFIDNVKPGLVLTQVGMGLGVIAGCRDILVGDRAQVSTNQYLTFDDNALQQVLLDIEQQAVELANVAENSQALCLSVLRLRAMTSEWALKASQSAALHVGARGYLMRHPAQRRLREAMFVAIVTPALKHLRQEIARLEQVAA